MSYGDARRPVRRSSREQRLQRAVASRDFAIAADLRVAQPVDGRQQLEEIDAHDISPQHEVFRIGIEDEDLGRLRQHRRRSRTG